MKILLLEDDFMLNEMIDEYLTSTGHLIKSTSTGNECLKLLGEQEFDLLILDINVPDINGFTILETLHNQKRDIPTIYISALIDIEDISRAFDIGCYDYLKKPFHLKELTIRINRLLKNQITPTQHKRLSKSYSFDCENLTLYFNNEPHILPRRQIKIIEVLAKNRSLIVDYDMFKEYAYAGDEVDISTIRSEINRVKKVLKEDFIINIRGSGYMIKIPQ
ncbi:response regulator transcription factor [Halarcobacter sp.]|uniref:response regulator transcription factor n=1 Tax=Halarcobacter sp. TaxID=2321133 RepID=UPI003A93044F